MDTSRWNISECPSSTQVQLSLKPQIPSVHVLGTSENPVDITDDEEDKKPITNPLLRLKPLRYPNKDQVFWQNYSQESERMKKLLVSELISPDNITMDINTMIDRANGFFDTLSLLGDVDENFYQIVRKYIYWYHELSVADGLRNELYNEIMGKQNKLQADWKQADEGVQKAGSDLSSEENKLALIQEKLSSLKQELAQTKARVIMLAVEKEKREQVRSSVSVKLMVASAKVEEGTKVLMKIDDRRKAAFSGISEMTQKLKSFQFS